MKSKRRHELQTNELADQLGHWIESIRPYLATFCLVVVGITAILAAWYYVSSSRRTQTAQAWRLYFRAGTDPQTNIADELGAIADTFSDTLAGLWAAQTTADVESAQGVRLLFTDRASAETSLNLAESRYREVIDNELAVKNPMLIRRARFGLAQTLEAKGDLDEAKKYYSAVIDGSGENALAKAAQERIDRVGLASTQKWYNWFERQKPAPRDLGAGSATGAGLDLPASDLNMLPDEPSEDFLNDSTEPDAKEPAEKSTDAESGPQPPQDPPTAPDDAASGEPEKTADDPAKKS